MLTTAGLTLGNAFAARGLPAWLQVSLVAPVSAAAVFGAVHWVFGKYGRAAPVLVLAGAEYCGNVGVQGGDAE